MKKIFNENHVDLIVRAIYKDAEAHGWENQTLREHTEQYGRWLADPSIGGLLTQWMSPEEARVWLKDCPMKEFSRAQAGQGAFAKYLDAYPRSAHFIVSRAMGPEWAAVPDSVGVKPLCCLVTNGTQAYNLYWGKCSDAKHLIWAALRTSVGTGPASKIVIYDSIASPSSFEQRTLLTKIATRCGFELIFVRL